MFEALKEKKSPPYILTSTCLSVGLKIILPVVRMESLTLTQPKAIHLTLQNTETFDLKKIGLFVRDGDIDVISTEGGVP